MRFIWFWILICTALGAATGAFVRGRVPAIYESRARICGIEPSRAERELQSPALLEAAVANLPNAPEKQTSHAEPLQGELRAEPAQQEGFVEIIYRTPHRSRAVRELSTLLDTFISRQRSATPHDTVSLERQKTQLDTQRREQELRLENLNERIESNGESTATDSAAEERVRALGKALGEARVLRLQVEQQCTLIREGLQGGLGLPLLASRLEPGPARAAVESAAERAQATDELTRKHAEFERLSGIYGARHPQLIRLQQTIDGLERTLASNGSNNLPKETKAGGEWLLQRLDDLLGQRQRFEDELSGQLNVEQTLLNERAILRRDRDATAARLAGLNQTFERTQSELNQLRQNATQGRVKLGVPVWLEPDPIRPHPWIFWGAGAAVGMLLGMILSSWLGNLSRLVPKRTVDPGERTLNLHERRLLRKAAFKG